MSTKYFLIKSNVILKDYVDNNKVVFEPTKKEMAIAVWLSKKT